MGPNIVLIVADNQSSWTLGCYGNREIRTPRIDRLAREGIRFGNAFCVSSVCSPNRATLLTGLMPSQHGIHNWLGHERPDTQIGPEAYCTIVEFDNLPRHLFEAGYECGLAGKWHLGDSLRPQLGFAYWFTMAKGHTGSFYRTDAVWDGETHVETRYFPEVITDRALDFLRRRQDRPFFLYLPHNGPYGLDEEMRRGHRNRHTEYYADKPLDCFPREEPHPWLVHFRDCIGNPTAMRSYAAAVSGIDDQVGAILDGLDALGLSGNTMVIYTADHGLCAGHHGYWGTADHGRPLALFEENLRIPLIVRQPGAIPAGRTSGRAVTHADFYPTLREWVGLGGGNEDGLARAGQSYAQSLAGGDEQCEIATFHEHEHARIVRTPEWKYTWRFPGGPNELYDLRQDPGERNNRAGDPDCAAAVRDCEGRLRVFFERHSVGRHDLWRGGYSKAGRSIPELGSPHPRARA